MKKIILIPFFLLSLSVSAQPTDSCTYGVTTENLGIGVNVVTGGNDWEYAGAADFIVPFGKVMTVDQATVNILKGDADLALVNVTFWNEANGFPNERIATFDNLIPTAQELAYELEPGFSTYKITLDLPETVELTRGKYFIQISAIAGGEGGAWWEITNGLQQSYGVFDYITFDQGVTWEGSGNSDYVFSINGNCADSGEEMPDYGDACAQGDVTNEHEAGSDLIQHKVADDFIVPENTTFHLTHADFTVLSMGPGINNATINIRTSVEDMPGDIIRSIVNIGPTQEQFFDYWPWSGFPPLIPVLKWYFDFEPIALTAGKYFIEVVPNVFATEALQWEATSAGTNGGYSYSSLDGVNWISNEGYNQVFNVSGFCEATLGVENPQSASNLTYYPNPVENVLNISSSKGIKAVEVYNTLGQKVGVYTDPAGNIDMKNLSSGMYLLKVQSNNAATETIRILKK